MLLSKYILVKLFDTQEYLNLHNIFLQEYASHIQKEVHIQEMKRVKLRLQRDLQRLRKKQRENQKELDSSTQTISSVKRHEKSGYCKTCKLMFKNQSKYEHEKSDFHGKIENFLHPKCAICNIAKFFTPLAYEKHIATLGHIKV